MATQRKKANTTKTLNGFKFDVPQKKIKSPEELVDETRTEIPEPQKNDVPWSVMSNWPTQTKAASRLGITQRRFLALMADGSIKKYKAQDKTIRFDPEELDALRSEIDLSEQSEDIDAEERKAAIALIREQSDALKDAREHIKQLIAMITEPMRVAQETSANIVAAAIERVKHLEEIRDEMIATREAALDHAAERDAFLAKEKAAEQRKDEAFNLAKANAPKLIAGLEATLFGKGKLKKLVSFVESLDPGMVSFLLDSEVLNEQQRKDLLEILPDKVIKEANQAKEKAKEEQS